jgi:hypothetical protein
MGHRPWCVLSVLVAAAGCAGEPKLSTDEGEVWRDGDDWAADNGAHPQVIRIMRPGAACTAFLSSSNTLTTNAHCLASPTGFAGWSYDTTMVNSNPTQFAALVAMGTSTAGFIHPNGMGCPGGGGDSGACCWGGDMAVLVFPTPMPRNVMRPVRIKAATSDEPECSGDDTCVMMIGAGGTGETQCNDDSASNPPLDTTATQLHVESGLGDGHCPQNEDMLYGEYDFDDSSICNGDSGSPVFWKGTDEVFAQARGFGGDGGDDVTGPILWGGGANTARDFYMSVAGDSDNDTLQAADDNCDLVGNVDQADQNMDMIGDACQDSDGDGLNDDVEIAGGTDPNDSDSDDDGLSDGQEISLGTDPNDSDTDNDGLSDGAEVNSYGTDPLDADSDNDGLSDGAEVNTHGTNPLDPDTDNDGLSDGAEVNTHGTNPLDADSDDDGLSDGAEVNTHGTNPLDPDTDDDGLTDGDEVLVHGTDPLDPDTDDDLLTDGFEVGHGTDPLDADSDDDGVIDGQDTEWIEAAIDALPDSAFKAPGHRAAIAAKLAQVEHFAQQGKFAKALSHLINLRTHVDGCGADADANDWLVDCTSQLEVRALLDVLAANL